MFFGKPRSFTLIELIITLVIMGILATLGFTNYQGLIWKSRFVEVYNTVYSIARAEARYYLEKGVYTLNPTAQCYAGNGVATGSTDVQKQLNLEIPSTHFFQYLVYPSTTYPTTTNIYFAQPGYGWCWVYNYVTKSWYSYGGTPGPGCQYFRRPPQ